MLVVASRDITFTLNPTEYSRFVAAIPNEKRLPHSYDDWLKRALEQNAKLVELGIVPDDVVVDYEGFIAFCDSCSLLPDYELLKAYANVKAA